MPPTTIEEISAGLRARSTAAFEAAVSAAVRLGPDGDRLLSALGAPPGWRGVYVCAALGDVRGPHGAAVLRQVVDARGSGTSDRRCAALLALAKRGEHSAVEVLVDALGDRDAGVREYALIGLAAVGDDRAWEPVRARLEAVLARRRTHDGEPPLVAVAVTCLVRTSGGDPERTVGVAALLRRRWANVTEGERRWLAAHWPSLGPEDGDASSPAAPDPADVETWIRAQPLFSAPAVS